MTNMTERVARAIVADLVEQAEACENGAIVPDGGFDSNRTARAAIAAMREPTYWIPMTDAALEPLNAETPRPGSLGAEDMGPRFSENIDPKPDWRTAAAMLAEGDAMIDAAIERAAKPPNGPARRDPAT